MCCCETWRSSGSSTARSSRYSRHRDSEVYSVDSSARLYLPVSADNCGRVSRTPCWPPGSSTQRPPVTGSVPCWQRYRSWPLATPVPGHHCTWPSPVHGHHCTWPSPEPGHHLALAAPPHLTPYTFNMSRWDCQCVRSTRPWRYTGTLYSVHTTVYTLYSVHTTVYTLYNVHTVHAVHTVHTVHTVQSRQFYKS